MHRRKRTALSSSNNFRGVETNTNLDDEGGIHCGMKSDLSGVVDATVDLEETGASTDSKKEDGDKSKRPRLASHRISAGSADLLAYVEALNEKETPSKNVESGMKNGVDLPFGRRLNPSPAPLERGGANSGKTSSSSSVLSRDTLALARLYHSSRRSRHHGPKGSGDSAALPSEKLSPPLLARSSSWDIQQISYETSTSENIRGKGSEWSFHIASPIYNSRFSSNDSVSSMESEEVMTGENDIGSEMFGEVDNGWQPKGQKIASGK